MTESLETSRPSPAGPRGRPGPCVVGLGASAGGIGALRDFFAHVDPHGGSAYVVIVHLSPDHDSRLAAVLQSATAVPVIQVTGTTPIASDHVYVVPPNTSLGISDGTLTVAQFTRREQRLSPVDAFFRGLADTHGSRSACVILSGTGHDGSAGLRQIKEYGGLVIAQDPLDAEYPDMPRSAIATGLVDLILPAAAMPPKIAAFFDAMSEGDEGLPRTVPIADEPEAVREVLTLLRVRTGHDFSNYKAPTVARRIERRMNLRGVDSASAYARLVRQEPTEAVSLLQELLISVTHFSRSHSFMIA